MNRFWHTLIEPALAIVQPRVVVEIGAETGRTTEKLLGFCREHDAVLHAIDPLPKFDVAAWQEEFGPRFIFHQERSLVALPEIGPSDAVLIDGDHNWYTVYHELRLLDEAARHHNRRFPLVFLHDVGWPYGRRDLYYNPEDIPDQYRQPYLRQGMKPGESDLEVIGGLNSHLCNAVAEGGPRNGVLTAVEDFLAERTGSLEFIMIPALQGLGIICPAELWSGEESLRNIFLGMSDSIELASFVESVERDRIALQVRSAEMAQRFESERLRAAEQSHRLVEERAARGTAEASLRELQTAIETRNQNQEEQAERLRQEVASLRAEANQASQTLREFQAERSILRSELNAERDLLRTELARAREVLQQEHEREREHLRIALEHERTQNEQLRAEVDGLQAATATERAWHADLVREHARERETLRDELVRVQTALTGELERGQEQISTLRAALEEEHGARAREIQEHDRVIAEVIGERELLRNALTIEREERQAALAAERDVVSSERRQKEDALAEQQRLHMTLGALEAELDSIRAARSEEKTAAARAHAALERAHAEAARARANQERFQGEVEHLQHDVASALTREEETVEALREAGRHLAQIEVLLARVNERLPDQGKLGKSKRELNVAQKEVFRVREQVGTLRHTALRPPEEVRRDPLPYDPNRILPGRPESGRRAAIAPTVTRHRPADLHHPDSESAPGGNGEGEAAGSDVGSPVDIIICVHDALDDVRRCLESVVQHTSDRHRVIVVDDGSDAPAAAYLQAFVQARPHALLLRNERPSGYTKAANRGLRAATADMMVLLNSDAIVTPHWLERLLECASSDQRIGIVGPLSNAASYQSVPERFDPNGDWALNPAPPGWDIDGIAAAVARISSRAFPRVPFVNGFCFAIARAVVEAIGYFDEDGFPDGYGEENDYCLRAADAGFALAIADQSYVYHAKSRSYSHERRRKLGKEGRGVLLGKHGAKRLEAGEAWLRDEPNLARMRLALGAYLQAAKPANGAPSLSVLFLLPVSGSGGGAHSVVQEASGMRRLGINAQVAVWAQQLARYRENYPAIGDSEQLFFAYRTQDELQAHAERFSVVVATFHTSMPLLADIAAEHPTVVPAYYIQDYEPFFYAEGSPGREEAARSYLLVPNAVLFAKTRWLCETVGALHDVIVHKVSPSLDHDVYFPPPTERRKSPVRVVAMIRPSSARRGAGRTMATLRRLSRKFGKRVAIEIFGCDDIDLAAAGLPLDFRYTNHGMLTREGVAATLRESDVFLDLSDYQAFGRTGLEAMACGCAVVLPALGGVSEYAIHGENALLVDTSNTDICYGAAHALVKHRAFREHLGQAGLATAASYSIELAANSQVNLFSREWMKHAGPRPSDLLVADTSGNQSAAPNLPVNYIDIEGPAEVSTGEFCGGSTPTNAATDMVEPDDAATSGFHPNLVTVIVPIFDAFEEVKMCLESLVQHGKHQYQALLIDDASTDIRIWPLLQSYSALHSNFFIMRNDHNLGYTATINRACRLVPGDVILLNSDTQVTRDWIEKLAACAMSRPNVATVTALSNAAGAFSVPINGQDNELPRQLSIDEMATLVERLSTALRPSVPTGNGFCLYITRRALETVGFFDEENFPFGYGEENDFCMRASAKGFIHLVDDSTFVYHARSASFGTRKRGLAEQNRIRLEQLHPAYKRLVTTWQNADPLNAFRAILLKAIQSPSPSHPASVRPCVLYILHDGDGGSVHTTKDLIQKIASHLRCLVLKTGIDSWTLFEYVQDALVPIRRYNFRQSWQVHLHQYEERRQVIVDICSAFDVSLAHVRHLLANEPEVIKVLKAMGIAVVFSFHDFYTVCPTIHLIDNSGAFCGGKCTAGSGVCKLSRKWFRGEVPVVKHAFVYEHRMNMGESLAQCDRYITTSKAAQRVLENAFPFLESPAFRVIEHGRDLDRMNLAVKPLENGTSRIVCFGALGEEKGIALLESIMRLDSERGPRFEFHLLGRLPRGVDLDKHGAVYHGPYEREDLMMKLAELGPSFAIIPSIASETYCHTLTEAWAAGLPVFASKIGALQERIENYGGGWLFANSDAEAFYNGMIAVLDNTEEYQRQLEAVSRIPLRSLDDMAKDYLSVYQELLPISEPSLQPVFQPSAKILDDSAERRERLIDHSILPSIVDSHERPRVQNVVAHIEPREVKLDDLVAMIERHEIFSLSRWGDGEWFTVLGRTEGRTRGGQKFRAEVGAELRRVLSNRPPYLLELVSWERTFGSQVHEWLIEQRLDDLDWINPNILHRASMSGWLGDAICALRNRASWIAVGPEHLRSAQGILGFTELIPVPEDCFPVHAQVLERVLQTAKKLPRSAVITFSVGMTAKILVDDVFQRLGDHLTLLDTGSLWDPFAGVFSRSYMEKEIFKQRLEAEKHRQLRIISSLASQETASTSTPSHST